MSDDAFLRALLQSIKGMLKMMTVLAEEHVSTERNLYITVTKISMWYLW